MPDALFEIGRRLCSAVGIDQKQARRLTDAERHAVAMQICRLAEIGSKQVSSGRLGAALAHGSPGDRRERHEQMQADAERIYRVNPAQSWRRIAEQVGRMHGVTGRTVRQHCRNPKAGK